MSLSASMLALTLVAALPPITSPAQALGQLGAADDAGRVEALKNLDQACRGAYRRDLRDRDELAQKLSALYASGSLAVKKGVLDTARCFSPAKFLPFVERALADADPGAVAYGAEVAARLDDPVFAEPLLNALAKRADACSKPGVAKEEFEACVWVTYAPSTVIARASAEIKKRAGELGARMLDAPYAKVREVAVETLAATGLHAHAADIGLLIARETKKGGFEEPNSAELIARFKQRQKALEKAK